MLAVTTFPKWGWKIYAKHCMETWVRSWPGSILAYYEGAAPPAEVPGIEFRPLNMPERDEFLSLPFPKPVNYLHDARRFCHKVFAQLDALDRHGKFYWLDADVEILSEIPESLLDDIAEKSFVSFLGRDTYTETGVIAFNKKHPDFLIFQQRYRACYTGRVLFKLRFWTDCHAFDYAREGGGYNITPDGRGVDNVLESSPLGKYMVHHKGNRKLLMEEHNEPVSADI